MHHYDFKIFNLQFLKSKLSIVRQLKSRVHVHVFKKINFVFFFQFQKVKSLIILSNNKSTEFKIWYC